MTKRVAGFGAAVMATLLALVILWQFRIVLVYVLISLTLAAALRPLVNRLVGQGLLARAAWILLYLAALGGLGFLLFQTGEIVIGEIQQLANTVSAQDAWKLPLWLQGTSFEGALVGRLPPPSKLFEAVTGDQGQFVLPVLLGFTQGIGGVVTGALVILFLSLYWSINQIHFERLWFSLLPSDQRREARGIWRTVEPGIGAYIRSQIIHSLLAGLLLGLGYWLLGSPYPALLALSGALACLIPVVGTTLAIIPPLLVGPLTSIQLGLWTVLYALVVLIALGAWVKPRLFNRTWHNPMLTMVLLIALADAFGLVGIIVAPLLSVVCQIVWNRLVIHRLAAGDAAQISDLIARQERVRAAIAAMDEPPPPVVTNSMERLAQLIEKAEPILKAALLADPAEPLASPAPVVHGGPPVATKP